MNLRQIGEFGLIRRIRNRFPPPPFIPLGIGDDAAAILPASGQLLLATTDSQIEGVHFNRAFSTFHQIGYKSVMVNVSDIAAMGGTPRYLLMSLGLAERQTVEEIDQLYQGIGKASGEAGLVLIGGNISSTKGPFFISPTLLGEVPKKEMVGRGGARAGEALYVTGSLGEAAAGLALLREGIGAARVARPFARLLRRYRTPQARWREGRLLARRGIPSAMIDLSDGLAADLRHLIEESRLGAEIDGALLPISSLLKRAALQTGVNPIEYALNGGEDYELLFSVPEKKIDTLEKLIRQGLIEARRIGRMMRGSFGLRWIEPDGRKRLIGPGGWDHFKK
ncbi:MAG: thiamine-phosphate kinase [Candidatus Manganitrophaceae bacterium]